MEIKDPKFKLGQKAYYLNDGKVVESTIVKIEQVKEIISAKNYISGLWEFGSIENTALYYDYETISNEGVKEYWDGLEESELFFTQEALFESMKVAS